MPDTNCIKFCENIGLTNDYLNTVDFDNISAQTLFWDNKVKATYIYDNVKWITKNKIRVGANYNDVKDFSYAFFENTVNGVKKRTYCFLLRCEMIGNGVAEFTYDVDVLQTFMFDIDIKESFIEREHQDRYAKVNNIIERKFNTINENLDYGNNYKVVSAFTIEGKRGIFPVETPDFNTKNIMYCIITATRDSNGKGLFGETPPNNSINLGGIISPFLVYVLPFDINNDSTVITLWESGTRTAFSKFSDLYAKIRDKNQVINVALFKYTPFYSEYACSKGVGDLPLNDIRIGDTAQGKLVGYTRLDSGTTGLSGCIVAIQSYYQSTVELGNTLPNNKTVNFTPSILNNYDYTNETKIYTNPYKYLLLTNYGESKVIPFEKAEENKIYFSSDLESGCKQYFEIYNLNDDRYGIQETLVDNKINSLPLVTDAWKNYLLNQKANVQSGLSNNLKTTLLTEVGGFASAVAGVFTANPLLLIGGITAMAGGVVSYQGKVDSILANEKTIQQQPETQRTGNNIHFDGVLKKIGLRYYVMSAEDKYLERIANYFNHFGYKSGEFKIPNLKSRYYFNYIKIVVPNITGDVNNDTLNKIKNIYENGITIWHYRDSTSFRFLDYSKDNVEMSLL